MSIEQALLQSVHSEMQCCHLLCALVQLAERLVVRRMRLRELRVRVEQSLFALEHLQGGWRVRVHASSALL